MFLYLDIETAAADGEAARNELAAGIKPPANYKKPETIAAWEANEKPALVEEAIARTALDAAFGRVAVIGWALGDMAPEVVGDVDEKTVLWHFFAMMKKLDPQDIVFVGHGVNNFDLRFIWQRSVVQRLVPPSVILGALRSRPWDGKFVDTMTLWNPDPGKRISLDRLCKALGVPSPKATIDGAMVPGLIREGRFAEVIEYCGYDVEAVRACHRRMIFA